jgi:hypothetical protein
MALAFSIEWFGGYTLRRLVCQQCQACGAYRASWRSAMLALAGLVIRGSGVLLFEPQTLMSGATVHRGSLYSGEFVAE